MAADAQAVDDFLANPLGFMKSNLVRAPSCQTRVYGRPLKLTFSKADGSIAQSGGRTLNVYALREAENGEPSFESYICDFQASEISYQVLSKEAFFVFTFAMDGCTFSVGRPTPEGDVMVSHGNAKGLQEGGNSQSERQRNFALQLHGNVNSMLEPELYRSNGDEVATTFGIRVNSAWKFYYQSYKVTKKSYPPAYQHMGVFDFAGKAV